MFLCKAPTTSYACARTKIARTKFARLPPNARLWQTGHMQSKTLANEEAALRARALDALAILLPKYPILKPLLNYINPWQLLVGTVLAAQCTDKRVNEITPALFARWPGPAELAEAEQTELEAVIFSAGFYRNKAKNLIGAAREVSQKHRGEVPKTMEELTALPGLGRKSAGVLLSSCFDVPAIVVDTHFGRVTRRLGFTEEKDPVRLEYSIASWLPSEHWNSFSLVLNFHGRDICHSRKPNCCACPLAGICPSNICAEKTSLSPSN